MKKQAFSSEQYLNLQRDHILDRINQFDGKLYLEFGGKMLEDFHAARVLPGYEPDNKIKLLQELKDQVEVVIAINASNILAYEAATADLDDVNMIDPFHLETYGKTTVNYNRDIEIFPVLKRMLERILGESPYASPTDMGVNMVGFAITDDEAAKEASKQEIIRRYYQTVLDFKNERVPETAVKKIELLMNDLGITPEDRQVVVAARAKAEETGGSALALELPNGQIVTGKNSELFGPTAAALINASYHSC